jgi:type II secretory pathway pseudopilin PulG
VQQNGVYENVQHQLVQSAYDADKARRKKAREALEQELQLAEQQAVQAAREARQLGTTHREWNTPNDEVHEIASGHLPHGPSGQSLDSRSQFGGQLRRQHWRTARIDASDQAEALVPCGCGTAKHDAVNTGESASLGAVFVQASAFASQDFAARAQARRRLK